MKKITCFLVFTLSLLGTQLAVNAQNITSVAGTGTSGYSGDGGQATLAKLLLPQCVTADPAGNVYVGVLGSRIRKIAAGTNVISTCAGTGTNGFSGDGGLATAANISLAAYDMATDAAGNIYFTDGNRIRKITTATGIITTVAGNGASGYGGDGGLATAAQLSYPQGIAVDAVGNIYYTEYNTGSTGSTVRKITAATGIITTIAGTPSAFGFSGDGGPATAATLQLPWDVAVDASGNVYIADYSNFRIRKVDALTGIITTIAGTGIAGATGDGGPATAANIIPLGLIIDPANNIYFTDVLSHRVRRIDALSGIITTIAGTGVPGFAGNNGPATLAQLNAPSNLAMDASGNIYIADQSNQRVRKIATGCSAVVAGTISGNGANPSCGTASSLLTLTGATAAGVNYQWRSSTDNVNWVNTGTNSTSYATGTVSSTMYYKAIVSCATGAVKDSTPVYTFTVHPMVTPTVTITAAPGSIICSGTPVTFTAAISNGGTTPAFQWKKGTANVGTNSATYTDNALINGNTISVVLTSNAVCAATPAATSNSINMIVNTASASVVSAAICSSQLPYLWNGISVTAGGSNAAIFTTTNSNGCDSVVTLNLSVNNITTATANISICSSQLPYTWNGMLITTGGNNAAVYTTQNTAGCDSITTLNLNVSPALVPAVTITATPGTVVNSGTVVSFLATPVNGGTSPVFAWKKNSILVGGSGNSYTDPAPGNGDIISCTLHSNAACVLPDTAAASLTMTVNVPPPPCHVPDALITTDVGFSSARFAWTAVAGASGYEYVFNQSAIAPATGAFTTDTFYNATLLGNGTYYFHLRSRCPSGQYSPWISIKVKISDGSTGINGRAGGEQNLLLYPNPNKGIFTVEGAFSGKSADIDIVDYAGRVVYRLRESIKGDRLKKEISLPGLITPGAYLLRIVGSAEVAVIRFIITK